MKRLSMHVAVWYLAALTIACTVSPAEPTGLGQTITITYQSTVPVSTPWPSDRCGTTDADRQPIVLLNWSGAQIPMEQGAMNAGIWWTNVLVPTNVRLDISVRDPGLCRMPYASYGDFAWSGVAINGTVLPALVSGAWDGKAPCFAFRVSGDGEVTLEK